MKRSALRRIPSVEGILQALGDTGLPRPTILAAVRRELAALRKRKAVPEKVDVLSNLRDVVGRLARSRIQPVINGTGILIHTNFGRAPLGAEVIETISKIGAGYSSLEYDLSTGERGGRAAYLEHNLALLCGAESATAVNNNAAALVLILRHFCASAATKEESRRTEVIVSRGELIQIGGGFRMPDILEASGARLREIGTTNKTAIGDYARAIGRNTAMILKVHRSNFFMSGFVESPATEAIAAIARKTRTPFIEDLGSGAAVRTEESVGVEHETTPAEALRQGIDLVCFSGDKLFGGPQSGIIAGKARLVAALKREPFFRAFRCDKLILSALQTTVDLYLRDETHSGTGVPVLEMLRLPQAELSARAEKIVVALSGIPLVATVGEGRAQVGGGTLPRSAIASVTIDLAHSKRKAHETAKRLREHPIPVIGYISRGKLKLDLRTIFPWQDAEVINAIRAASD